MFSILLLIMIPLGMCEPFLGIRFENPLQLKHCLANYGVKHGYQLWYMQNDMYKYLQEHALMMDEEALREEQEEPRSRERSNTLREEEEALRETFRLKGVKLQMHQLWIQQFQSQIHLRMCRKQGKERLNYLSICSMFFCIVNCCI